MSGTMVAEPSCNLGSATARASGGAGVEFPGAGGDQRTMVGGRCVVEGRRNRKGRTPGAGLFARRSALRLSREEVAERARLLPTLPQALVTAYFSLGMSVEELALMHRRPRLRLYRILMHWRDTLSDPAFILAAHYAGALAPELAELARAHWMEGMSLRQLAVVRQATVHEIRTQLAEARVALVTAAARRHAAEAAAATG